MRLVDGELFVSATDLSNFLSCRYRTPLELAKPTVPASGLGSTIRQGYVTVTPESRLLVSKRIREE